MEYTKAIDLMNSRLLQCNSCYSHTKATIMDMLTILKVIRRRLGTLSLLKFLPGQNR